MDDPRPKSIILDIDGVIFHQYDSVTLKHRSGLGFSNLTGLSCQMGEEGTLLPGVREKFHEWDRLGYNIILMTGRKESMRALTERQLEKAKLYYDGLIMGVGGGVRVLINNAKTSLPDMETAIGITIPKNKGLVNLDL